MRELVYSCHQPNFLPWIGYFHKISNSDNFVILDEVQYTKNSVANRNLIKSPQGEQMITVPMSKKVNGSSFFSYREAMISQPNWYEKIIKTIHQNYNKAPYFEEYKNIIFDILSKENFCEMNISFIKFIALEYRINTQIFLMSELKGIEGKKNDLLISIGECLKSNIYISGKGAKKYNDIEKFERNKIQIRYQDFNHPKYSQLYTPFVPYLSVLDLLFNEGKDGGHFFNECRK